MIKVRITARNFSYGPKIYGTGGEYPVDERTARYMVNNGKAVVIEGVLSEEEDVSASINDAAFMAAVRRNALKIGTIVQDAFMEQQKAERDAEDAAEAAEKASKLAPQAPSAPITNDNSEGDTKLDDSVISGNDKSKGANDASDSAIQLPEDFPGREVLVNAGITTVDGIPSDKESLMAVEGMTAKLANQIGVKLSKD